ncbi:hypothetical protein [Streptomyces sp. HUAS TT20]|nr:hypothetical protein [Streptomyces sp. HUAS 15-9]UXY32057.1 hypothetical protein N8I87_39570 [Streptomyces sp. HUAS 15-9]
MAVRPPRGHGGVLLTVSDGEGSGRNRAIAWAAQLSRNVGSTLYP